MPICTTLWWASALRVSICWRVIETTQWTQTDRKGWSHLLSAVSSRWQSSRSDQVSALNVFSDHFVSMWRGKVSFRDFILYFMSSKVKTTFWQNLELLKVNWIAYKGFAIAPCLGAGFSSKHNADFTKSDVMHLYEKENIDFKFHNHHPPWTLNWCCPYFN